MEKWVHIFSKSNIPRVNVMTELEFEVAYYDLAVKHASHYATGSPSEGLGKYILDSQFLYNYECI